MEFYGSITLDPEVVSSNPTYFCKSGIVYGIESVCSVKKVTTKVICVSLMKKV